MASEFTFRITTTRFDEDYSPSDDSRITTNFANLARGEHRQQNLRNALTMIDRRFNDLAHWDNPSRDRYTLELEIVSVAIQFATEGEDREFPLLEVLEVTIVDRSTGTRTQGIVGNNFSSYIRDFDFSVRLPAASEAAGVSPSPTTSAICTASSSSTSSIPRPTGSASRCRPSSASASRRARRTAAPRTTTPSSVSSTSRRTAR